MNKHGMRIAIGAGLVFATSSGIAGGYSDDEICIQMRNILQLDANAVRAHARDVDSNAEFGEKKSDLSLGAIPCDVDASDGSLGTVTTELVCGPVDATDFAQLVSFARDCTVSDMKDSSAPGDGNTVYFRYKSGRMLMLSKHGRVAKFSFVY